MSASGSAKLSISLPRELAKSLSRRVRSRSVSEFAARAIRHELERERLGDLLADLDDRVGPVPSVVLAEARAAWHKS